MNKLMFTPAVVVFAIACAPQRPTDPPVEAPRNAASTPPAQQAPSPRPARVAAPARATPALALEGEGLRLFDRDTGSARPIAFATPRAVTLAALGFRGPPETGTQRDCGAGSLDYAAWPDGLKLYFQRDQFVGWAVDGRGRGTLATAAGVGPGSTRAALSEAHAARFTTTTLGTEFAAGGLFGLLDGSGPKAVISDLWAGASCNFR